MIQSVAIVPAAGKAERFGSQKLVADLDGRPLIERTIQSLIDAGAARVIVVCAPSASGPSAVMDAVAAIADARVEIAINGDPSRGMFSSIQTGFAAVGASGGDPVLVLPADMPFVRPETVAAVWAECVRTGRIVSPTFQGRRGHPLAVPRALRDEILAAPPETTLSEVLARYERVELPLGDPGIVRDVDVPADIRLL